MRTPSQIGDDAGYHVHPSAVVDEGAVIGSDSQIWHHAHIRSTAVIGNRCVIGKGVYIDADARLGDRCKIQNNASVYRGVTLADEVFVGPGATFTNDLRPRANAESWDVVSTTVNQGASLGANATIVCGTTIGQFAMVGAGSVVTRDVLPHELVVGNPARHAGWVCECGEVVARAGECPADLRCPRHRATGDEQQVAAIAITAVHIGAAEEALVLDVLRSGHLAQGPMVERLEQRFAAVHDVKHAVAVNNGTSALVAALLALDLGPGDEVITTPFSFVATLNAILEVGATARFADIGADMTLDPDAVEALIGPRTRAVMPVHLFGLPVDMGRLGEIARRHGLALIEDAAQAHGARVAGRAVGSFGVGCFSLYATKNITSGEGGLITTDSDEIADRLRLLRNQGMRARYQYELAGHNFRMTDVQAAIALPQVERLAAINAARRRNAALLTTQLRGLPGLTVPIAPVGSEHVFHQYTVRLDARAALDRDALAARLAGEGIGSGVYYPRLMHEYACYESDPRVVVDPTPRAAQAAREVLSLPVHPHLDAADLDRIAHAVKAALS